MAGVNTVFAFSFLPQCLGMATLRFFGFPNLLLGWLLVKVMEFEVPEDALGRHLFLQLLDGELDVVVFDVNHRHQPPSPPRIFIVSGPLDSAVLFILTAATGLRNWKKIPSTPKVLALNVVAGCPIALLTPDQKARLVPPTIWRSSSEYWSWTAAELVPVVETKMETVAGLPPRQSRALAPETPGTLADDKIIVWLGTMVP